MQYDILIKLAITNHFPEGMFPPSERNCFMSTFLVSLAIIIAVVLALRSLKRSGGCSCSGCSGGCAGCHGACHCSAAPQPAATDASVISAPRRTIDAYQGLEPPADR